jgi:AraC-like DNA-binding protein
MPDGCVDLFVTPEGNVMVAGPATTFYDLFADRGCVLAGLRFRPGAAAAALGQPAIEFRDNRVPVDSVFGVARYRVAENLLATTTPGRRATMLQGVLTGYFRDVEPLIDRAVTQAVELLQMRPDWPVSSLAVAVGLSERQLRRRFETAVGYGPKRFGRIVRFQRLLDLIHVAGGRVGWAELAIQARYADQSHMINECLALAGVSPTALPNAAGSPLGDVSVLSNTANGNSP